MIFHWLKEGGGPPCWRNLQGTIETCGERERLDPEFPKETGKKTIGT